MSEIEYERVEDAIRRKLYIADGRKTPLGGPSFAYPIAIENGDIVLRDADCGLARPTWTITLDEWRECSEVLFRMVGGWSFERADCPAADDIEAAHRNPAGAGWTIYRQRRLIEELMAQIRELSGAELVGEEAKNDA